MTSSHCVICRQDTKSSSSSANQPLNANIANYNYRKTQIEILASKIKLTVLYNIGIKGFQVNSGKT